MYHFFHRAVFRPSRSRFFTLFVAALDVSCSSLAQSILPRNKNNKSTKRETFRSVSAIHRDTSVPWEKVTSIYFARVRIYFHEFLTYLSVACCIIFLIFIYKKFFGRNSEYAKRKRVKSRERAFSWIRHDVIEALLLHSAKIWVTNR